MAIDLLCAEPIFCVYFELQFMMRVSTIVLTFNRAGMVQRAMANNIATAGCPLDELVWVDNGSTDHVRDIMFEYDPDLCILNKTNLGVSKGFNRGIALATGDYVLTLDSDMMMPPGWLMTFKSYLLAIPNTGVACMLNWRPGQVFDDIQTVHGLDFAIRYPIGRRVIARELMIKKIGYLREDFGLYGLEDVEWARRAFRVCTEEGFLVYAIPGQYAIDLSEANAADPLDYRLFKEQQGAEPGKFELLTRCHENNYPYYSPY